MASICLFAKSTFFIILHLIDEVTAPDRCYCLNQASLTRIKGRAGEFPVEKTNRSRTATDVVVVIK